MNDGKGWLRATEPGMSRQRRKSKAAGISARANLTGLPFFISTSRAGLDRRLVTIVFDMKYTPTWGLVNWHEITSGTKPVQQG